MASLRDGELLLLDAGAEYKGYALISRVLFRSMDVTRKRSAIFTTWC